MSSGTANPAEDQRSLAARVLVFGGITLILAGMLLGEIFAIFISHVASAQIRREWTGAMVPAIERHDLSAIGAGYTRIQDLLERRGRIMDAHSHVTAYGFLALALALLQPLVAYAEKIRRALAVAVVGGGFAQAALVFVSYWTAERAHNWVLLGSAVSGAFVFVGVLGNITGLRASALQDGFVERTRWLLSSPSSQILLRTGVCLILVGMVFGFYYAWVFVTQQEPRQTTLLAGAITSAVSRDPAGATASILAYRSLQSRIAIVTAAHSHIIEMGTMAVLLAFVQSFVFLRERWKRNWAVLFCVGGAIMPICTYSAPIYGLVFAGLADTFGMISLAALFVMLVGLVRQTGADDCGVTS